MMDTLKIGPYEFRSRLLLGTGKFADLDTQGKAVEVSEAEILTFAIRRLNLENPQEPNFLEQLDLKKFTLLPNTAGAYTAEEAVRIARLAKASGLCDMIKVEVIGDPKTLLPDPIGTFEASKILVEEGFIVLTYTNDDPILARRLQEVGVHAVMPGASPIGSGQGIVNENNLRFIIEDAKVPIIVDAGIGSPADCAKAMELGADGVLLNTAVALADNPVLMAEAMKLGVEAGRKGFLAGRIAKKRYASASSPTEGMIE
ncbi:thiazole synthase [Brevibacillus sp. HB1.2]|uniref:thiazole synthase n=1 Tax=Brevibacillus TaxID=55080 RepID=UPI000372656F|nr:MULTISPECIES: thiazole synthase [unclassified Brevibacillus]NRS18877.1 thiazole synthase [Brevibacillus sp. HB1.4B]NTU24216.1 thiazole synthase [Brevibacillus sp. HB1.2]NTU28564.1 thiazole synthase [Brevibacillus sp. HB1.1]